MVQWYDGAPLEESLGLEFLKRMSGVSELHGAIEAATGEETLVSKIGDASII